MRQFKRVTDMNRFNWLVFAVFLFAADQSIGSNVSHMDKATIDKMTWMEFMTLFVRTWPLQTIGVLSVMVGTVWYLFLHRKRSKRFTANVEEMSFSRRGFKLHVDQASKFVVVNGTKISPQEFSWREWMKHWSFGGGGGQALYNANGTVVGHMGGSSSPWIEITRGYNVDFFSNGKKVRTEKFSRRAKRSHEALIEVLTSVDAWCKKAIKQKAFDALDAHCKVAGIEKGYKCLARWDKSGELLEGLAADQAGKVLVILNKDAAPWLGTLVGASAQIVNDVLEFRVDDPAYRAAHMADRHFRMFKGTAREHLVEWESRINLLSKQVGATA